MSSKTPMLATKRHPLGKPGGPGLFHDKNLDLPPYVQNIAHSLMTKRGLPKSRAIQLALGAVERWKNGGDDVSPEVRAAAAKAWAQWEAAKAKAHATPNKSSKHANDVRESLARELVLAAARLSGVIDLAGPVQHWKHDWKPITPYAVAVKAKQLRGSTKGKPAELPKSVKAKTSEKKSPDTASVGGHGAAKAQAKKTKTAGSDLREVSRSSVPEKHRPVYEKAISEGKAHKDAMVAVRAAMRRNNEIGNPNENHIGPQKPGMWRVRFRKEGDPRWRARDLHNESDANRLADKLKRGSGWETAVDKPPAAGSKTDDAKPAKQAKSQRASKPVVQQLESTPQKDRFQVKGTLFEFPALPPEDSAPKRRALAERQALLEKAAKVKAPSKSRGAQGARTPKPGTGKLEAKDGAPGQQVTFAGGRTGKVWSDAPQGGKWVIPDDRKAGEAHAIYVDKQGDVHKQLSSRDYQRKYLEGIRRDNMPATARREREQAGPTPEDQVQKARVSALKDVSADDRKAYFAAYRRRLDEGMSPMDAHRKALQDMVLERSDRRRGSKSTVSTPRTRLAAMKG